MAKKTTNRILTIRQANAAAAGRVTVSADPIDTSLWQIEGNGWTESHEPMDLAAFTQLLRSKTTKTYDAGNGRRCTVPVTPDPIDIMEEAIRDQISPEAVAAIASFLQAASVRDSAVNKEIRWFTERLTDMVGGPEEQGRLAEGLGL